MRRKANRRCETMESRSAIMRAVGSVNTSPELTVRRLLHSLGYRYRLHIKTLPGTPDIVFAPRKKVVLVNGCFWHGHNCRRGARIPKTNTKYWVAKIGRNRTRDAAARKALRDAGWKILVLWECQMRDRTALSKRLTRFLG